MAEGTPNLCTCSFLSQHPQPIKQTASLLFFSCIDQRLSSDPHGTEDIAKTAIITPFALFEYLFKHLPFLFTYWSLDNHIIACWTLEEHYDHLRHTCKLGRSAFHLPKPATRDLFTVRTARWPEAIPLSSITTADCTRALFADWIACFGVPAIITSDRGAQFMSAWWAALCNLLNISHSPTTVYHPQSNGLVEQFHRWLKDTLLGRAADIYWCDHLPWVKVFVLLSMRVWM